MSEVNETVDIVAQDLGSATATASAESSFELYVQPDDEPPFLFHYTSPKGLLSIAGTSRIYATNIRYLNDASEYIYTHELFVGRQLQYIAEVKDQDVAQFFSYVRRSASNLIERDGDYYVVSFSADGDVLSQWRGYCPPHGGYSIGFSPADLHAAAEKEISLFPCPWRLVKCEYDGEKQFELVDDAIRSNVEAFHYLEDVSSNAISKFLRGETSTTPAELTGLHADMLGAIVSLAPVLKHGAYNDELEWRLVSPRIIDGDPCIEFRAGDFSVIPFVYFDLPPIIECIVGPNVNQALSARAAEQLCNVPIARRSKIPYRSLR